MEPGLTLASTSPRRHALLAAAGIEFTAVAPTAAEAMPERGDGAALAISNAEAKAASVEADLVLAADTVVVLGDRILGKPRDDEAARAMLAALSGTTHEVITGLALRRGESVWTRAVTTRVTMRVVTEAEIAAYVASGESAGKAGGYAIQEHGDRFVEELDGPYDNVVGLPVKTVRELLEMR